MKEKVLTLCEKEFVTSSLKERVRLDRREFDEFRELEIQFGADYGTCYVTLGETKAICKVFYELEEPKESKPQEGLIFIDVNINGMAGSEFDTAKQSDAAVRISRLLEKGIKDSNCVDLESLCIFAEETVWVLRVEVTVVNCGGNLATCCSVAALAALMHTRLPQVTVEGTSVTIHSIKEKSPLPLSVLHFPIAVTFNFFLKGTVCLTDPTDLEERVKESELVYYVNSYRELCGIHFGGKPLTSKTPLLRCANQAAEVADRVVLQIKQTLLKNSEQRRTELRKNPGFVDCINLKRINSASKDRTTIKVSAIALPTPEDVEMVGDREITHPSTSEIVQKNKDGTAILPSVLVKNLGGNWEPSEGKTTWEVDSSFEDSEESSSEDGSNESDVELVRTITEEDRIIDKIELSGDSEEEVAVPLESKDLENA